MALKVKGRHGAGKDAGHKRAHAAIYDAPQGALFVPTEDMWLVHEQATLSAVVRRSDTTERVVKRWSKDLDIELPKLIEWFYSDYKPRESFNRLPPLPNGQPPTALMRAVREEARLSSIANATQRSVEQLSATRAKRLAPRVSVPLICSWFDSLAEHEWFRPWLLRGQRVPDEVTVATRELVRRARRAWDYVAHLRATGVRDRGTYPRWLAEFPNQSYLRWLYGGPNPEGVFVVPLRLQRLRNESTETAICLAAEPKLGPHTPGLWRRSEFLRGLLQVLMAKASHGGTAVGPDALAKGDPRTLRAMFAYARAATVNARCVRAGLHASNYSTLIRGAERVGAKADLDLYLNAKRPQGDWRKCRSVFSARLFVPSPAMLEFRSGAIAAGAQVLFAADLPGLEEWFLDWVVPRATSGRRYKPPAIADKAGHAAAGHADGQAELGRQPTPEKIAEPPGDAVVEKPRNAQRGRKRTDKGKRWQYELSRLTTAQICKEGPTAVAKRIGCPRGQVYRVLAAREGLEPTPSAPQNQVF